MAVAVPLVQHALPVGGAARVGAGAEAALGKKVIRHTSISRFFKKRIFFELTFLAAVVRRLEPQGLPGLPDLQTGPPLAAAGPEVAAKKGDTIEFPTPCYECRRSAPGEAVPVPAPQAQPALLVVVAVALFL